ncbi:RHS repeat-associated core domain-containing protein [Kitasatospora sp. NPDC058402]|uniref:RHS repeat-associated core domain-containing protein n=3 Tax=unclassified Kitasatospora TaxID=2633591 RepID=UPI0036530120
MEGQTKLASLAQGSAVTTYVYDADGNQLIRRNPGKVTVNLGGGDELTYDTGTKTSTGTRYYSIPGGITLVRESPTKLTYQFADHHGTNTLSIGRDSLVETRRPTDPFGAPRGTTSSTTAWAGDKGYVGGLKDDATGFTNLGARQYQPSTGRFLSPDPLLLPNDPQQWNAYVYSNNDPVNKTDPTGMALEECASGMAKCSNMGTKVESEGPNYQKIVEQNNRDYYDTAREVGFGPTPAYSQRFAKSGPSNGGGNGIIMARFFIHMKSAAFGSLLGDNRSWSNSPADSARMTVFWDTDTGGATFTVVPSTVAGHHDTVIGGTSRHPTTRNVWVPPRIVPAKEREILVCLQFRLCHPSSRLRAVPTRMAGVYQGAD